MDKDKRPEVTLRAMEPEDLDVLYHVEMIIACGISVRQTYLTAVTLCIIT